MTNTFEGQIALVTGGTSGIGFGICESLLKRGAYVYVIGSRQASVEKAKVSLARYPNARFATADVKDRAAVEKIVNDCVIEFGRLDYMFNNAGISHKNPYKEVTLDLWKEMIDINLWGVIYGVNAALAVMEKQGSGHIINTSSVSGLFCTPYQAVYVTTKSAVIGLTECLRYEYEPKNIFFTVFCPGDVATPIFRGNIPPDAISVDEAVSFILDGVEKKELKIVFPDHMKELLEKCKDPAFFDMARKQSEEETRTFFETPEYQRAASQNK
jgi:NAD(P)-dependent dehydrogenase (short-subunit alcohol dehydrogenase family)